MSKDVAEEYLSSLMDLTINSKPLINMLTILADENSAHALAIVKAIEEHIEKVSPDVKLPILYLIDSIVKNVGDVYIPIFTNNIVNIFASAFEKVDEKTRINMFKVRHTWNDIFPARKLLALDVRMQHIDPNWPVHNNIHLNPKFWAGQATTKSEVSQPAPQIATSNSNDINNQLARQKEILLQLQKQKEQLELIQKQVSGGAVSDSNVAEKSTKSVLNDEAAKILSLKATLKPKGVVLPAIATVQPQKVTPVQVSNSSSRPKIAPATSQLIEAAKSRDPRLARQMLKERTHHLFNDTPVPHETSKKLERSSPPSFPQSTTTPLAASIPPKTSDCKASQATTAKAKEEEIITRQRAMLKMPVVEETSNKKSSRKKSEHRKRSSSSSNNSNSHKKSPKVAKHSESSSLSKESVDTKNRSKSVDQPKDETKVRWESPVKVVEVKDSKQSKKRSGGDKKEDQIPEKAEKPIETLEPPPPPRIVTRSPPPGLNPAAGSNLPDNTDIVDMDIDELPPTPSEKIKFKKGTIRGRNYSRRNKELSPSPPPTSIPDSSGVFTSSVSTDNNVAAPVVVVAPVAVNKSSEDIVEVAGKDIDFRQLPIGNSAKISPMENLDHRPPKKLVVNDDIMELFGSKDTDERLNIPAARQLPSPPPPPVISSATPIGSPAKMSSYSKISRVAEVELSEVDGAKSSDHRKPMEGEVAPVNEQDRLGRPLLYNRPSQESPLNGAADVDWRRGQTSDGINFEAVLSKTQQQYAKGAISRQQYHDVMEQVTMLSEKQMIREARRRHSMRKSPPVDLTRKSYNNDGRGNRRGEMPMQINRNELPYQRRPRGAWQNRFDNNRREQQNRPEWMDPDSKSQEWNDFGEESAVELPTTDLKLVEELTAEKTETIVLDGNKRNVRHYYDHAIVIISYEQARELFFENDIKTVFLAGLTIECQVNGPAQSFLFKNNPHSVRLGVPTREVNLDGKYYRVEYGDPPIEVDIDGVSVPLRLPGPAPQVQIVKQTRAFCLGFVTLMVDAKDMFQIFLDTKPQIFSIENKPFIIRFANSLTTILINDVPIDLKFGGDAKPVLVFSRIHFLRLSNLPDWVVPGKVSLVDMTKRVTSDVDNNSNSNTELQFSVENTPPLDNPSTQVIKGPLDVFTSLIGSRTDSQTQQEFSYHVNCEKSETALNVPPALPSVPAPPIPQLNNLNITDLLQSLVKTGLIGNQDSSLVQKNEKPKSPKATMESAPKENVIEVNFRENRSLCVLQPGLIAKLYSGIQCGSCGVRFAQEDTRRYSQHLDWHFRQNRRDKDAARRGASRRWYYDVTDWIQFEEIEDLEARAQSWFEVEGGIASEDGQIADSGGSSSLSDATSSTRLPSVAAPPGSASVACKLCHDRFDTFFHHDTEEWHLKNCLFVDGDYFHPACHIDYLKEPEQLIVPRKLPLLADLTVDDEQEKVKKIEETIIVDDSIMETDDGDVLIMTDAELWENAKHQVISEIVVQIVEDAIIEAEERMRKRIEDEELEVLAVKNKNEDKPPIDVIDVHDDGEIFLPRMDEPVLFDPNRKIKSEPLEMETPVSAVDQTLASIVSSIDGNVELNNATPTAGSSKIKITFSKTVTPFLQVGSPKPPETVSDLSEIEELDPPLILIRPKKPRIAERDMRDYPPIKKGTELSGLCNIM